MKKRGRKSWMKEKRGNSEVYIVMKKNKNDQIVASPLPDFSSGDAKSLIEEVGERGMTLKGFRRIRLWPNSCAETQNPTPGKVKLVATPVPVENNEKKKDNCLPTLADKGGLKCEIRKVREVVPCEVVPGEQEDFSVECPDVDE